MSQPSLPGNNGSLRPEAFQEHASSVGQLRLGLFGIDDPEADFRRELAQSGIGEIATATTAARADPATALRAQYVIADEPAVAA